MSEGPGSLELQMRRRKTPSVSDLVLEYDRDLRVELADSTAFLIALNANEPRYVKAVAILLRSLQRDLLLDLRHDADYPRTQRLRGQIAGLEAAEKLLTNPRSLAELKREMLGIPEAGEYPSGETR